MKKYTVFLSAGEPSGDFLGSQLMKALKKQLDGDVIFVGLGGALMAAEGLSSLFPIEELSIMGLAEIIPHIRRIRNRIKETVEAIETIHPDVVVTIDSPGFNFRVGKRLKKRIKSIPLVHYVAPSVWAWRPKRAHAVAQFLDHLLVLFPFEPPFFLKEGLPTTFVGHPVVELGLEKLHDPTFRTRHEIGAQAPILTLLPGSRRGEISRLLPVFQETVVSLQQKYPDIQVVIPTLAHLAGQIKKQFTLPATIITTPSEKFAAYKESQAALAASGTVSLELAAAGVPMAIAYKINPITHFLVRCLVKVKYACLVNLLMNEEIVPERLQEDCTSQKLVVALEGYFSSEEEARNRMVKKMQEAIKKLISAPYQMPSTYAAQQICQMMGIKPF
ncbi:MAG: lipid-A-disaccharide synthase [Candidatus Paracaedibacter sp.]